jgi:hypothetical protein
VALRLGAGHTDRGYLDPVKQSRCRRAHQIRLPNRRKLVVEHDTAVALKGTKLSSEHDTAVAPNKNQINNQTKGAEKNVNMSYIFVDPDELSIVGSWGDFYKTHIDADFGEVVQLLKNWQGIRLPVRFPTERDLEKYRHFFDMVIASKGKCFGG